MRDLARIFEELREALASGGSLVLLTDYDGTLTPLVGNPAEAQLPRDVRDDLCLLARSPRVRLGVLSGRALEDLRARIGLPELIYAGCHGLEVEGRGLRYTHPEAEARRGTIEGIARALRVRCASIPGIRVEFKGLAVALHCRTASPRSVVRLVTQLEWVLRRSDSEVRLLRGKKVIDILPWVQWNKGECALWIRDRLAPTLACPVVTLYMGDDQTDELAFDALAGKAITVSVGAGRTLSAAVYRVSDVSDVHRLLSALAAEVQKTEVAR